MRRRAFIAGLGGAVTWPLARLLAAEAQRRVGALRNTPSQSAFGPFREGLATFGWVEGRNLRIDYRNAGGDRGRLAAHAQELVNLRPDVIFLYGAPAAVAVQQRTSVIPIVFLGGGDPAVTGLVRNIARPEGNMTGFANWGAASQGASGWSCSRRRCLAWPGSQISLFHPPSKRVRFFEPVSGGSGPTQPNDHQNAGSE